MRATSFRSDENRGNTGEEAQVAESKMHLSKAANNSPSSVVDVEKGDVYQTEAPALLENLITPEEAEDHEQASHSKPLIVSEKIVVSLLVVCFVVVEAYFVGVSFRDWLDQQKHGNSTTVLLANYDVELVVPQFLQGPKTEADGRGRYEGTGDSEPFEDFEGGLSFRAARLPLDGLRHHQLIPASEKDSGENLIREEEALVVEDTAIREPPSFGH